MSRRRPRGLRPEEKELWQQVAGSARPLHPEVPRPRAADLPAHPPKPVKPPQHPALREFRLGEVATPATRAHDLAGTPGEELARAPLRMDRNTHARMTRGKLSPERRIDLHGMTLSQAHPELTRFILSSQASGLRLVLVITGKGKRGQDEGPIPQRHGVLKHQVPQWLAMPPLGSAVLQVTEAHLRHGGSGAYYVYLRRSR